MDLFKHEIILNTYFIWQCFNQLEKLGGEISDILIHTHRFAMDLDPLISLNIFPGVLYKFLRRRIIARINFFLDFVLSHLVHK